jgi:myosin protein heavy chain
VRGTSPSVTTTFAPQFIKPDQEASGSKNDITGIEGENDFSGKRYVWIKDPEQAFIKAWIIEEKEDGLLLVQCDDGSQREVDVGSIDKVNPGKFDKADDMAELTHLNEASVVHNLQSRYHADLIYTYSGLFLVAVNPYCPLSIYNNEYINMYKDRGREDTKPHIFAIAEEAFRHLVDEGENQSILVTGESGAGKTENTKKVIHYLASVAPADSHGSRNMGGKQLSNLSQQILRANPILESFGNAQTVRNNNSSRFGKFIRIEFARSGQITGASIEWYLLEKSRVVKQNSHERNYHIFYQLLKGAERKLKQDLHLLDKTVDDFCFTKSGNETIAGVSDQQEWQALRDAFAIMSFSELDQVTILRTVAAVLHLGNVTVVREFRTADQAKLTPEGRQAADKACSLLGIDTDAFIEGLLHPKVRAGREIVEKVQTTEQVNWSVNALAKGIYERAFGDLVSRINEQLDQSAVASEGSKFIGVLDIAGFEIFEENSFEQLCINYTNEKLQQFFNHHMFVLEQEEYARERIEWKFIDFGLDLQPTIDLIELSNPIGIFSCLDEDSVMPKATDKSFTEKLYGLWNNKTNKFRGSLLKQGFVLTHYAADVEYSTEGWLEKNKDPLNDNVTRLLSESQDRHVANLFADCVDPDTLTSNPKNRVKKGLFRTVAQRHKEQLSSLMNQLHATHPHFVRCIIPNHKKKPKQFNAKLVLDQLRCNGVLEGIRIARTGFPNRLPFAEFRQRYEVLCKDMPKGYLEGQRAAQIMLEKLNLDTAVYRVGLTKLFFRAGVLADLEEKREGLIREIVSKFQSVSRGYVQRRMAQKKLYRAEAARIIQRNFNVYLGLCESPWWKLIVNMKPLLGATKTSTEVKKRDEKIAKLELKMQQESAEKQKVEEDKRRADLEAQRIRNTLESERALALDKEEIFKRLQAREAELTEKLAEAIKDQDDIEAEMDDLIDAKKRNDDQMSALRSQLQQGGLLVEKLESEKRELSERLQELEDQLQQHELAQNQRSAAEETLEKEVRVLKSHIAMKDRKLQDLEKQLAKTDTELEHKHRQAVNELQVSQRQARELTEEVQQTRSQLSELSRTSTGYEDLVRRKESELSILRTDNKKHELHKSTFDAEKKDLLSQLQTTQSKAKEARAELDVLRSEKLHLEREAADARRLLEAKMSQDANEGQNRKILDQQIKDLKEQLAQVQRDLSRERQSRDDVVLIGEHKAATMKRDYDALNDAKITIEKELYAQQDNLRRALESRNTADEQRIEIQDELKKMRERYVSAEQARMEALESLDSIKSRQLEERQASLTRELTLKEQQLDEVIDERNKLSTDVQRLMRNIAESENFKLHHDQSKLRLERELVTIKGRLIASENDNKALLNKIQQKNLDIARSSSRAGDSQRAKLNSLLGEKARAEDESKRLAKQLSESQIQISAIEKQKEKLALDLEDLQHEISREHKASRNAEKTSSNFNLQLADANRNLETERQLKSQAQANTRKTQLTLDSTQAELADCRKQLLMLQKVFDPDMDNSVPWESSQKKITGFVDLASKLETSQQALRVANERCSRYEDQINDLRERHKDELSELDERYSSSKRALLEELNQNNIPSTRSPRQVRSSFDKPHSNVSTPTRRQLSNATVESNRSERTVDTVNYQKRMDMASELEMMQNQLQMSEMQNRHLQSQIDRVSKSRDAWQDESPSVRRVQKLERENNRLHDMLDDSAKKVSALESSLQAGTLNLRDVQTKTHEELFDLLNSQEQSKRSLLQTHNGAVADLAEAKTQFDNLKRSKAQLEVEFRNIKSEYEELHSIHEQDASSRNQLLQELSELQIRLDSEASRLVDTTASLNLYKARSDEYFAKLEQAELSVLKSSRAEKFAKDQAREAEENYADFMAEKKSMESSIEDLQRQTQKLEEKVEDLSADLSGALQAKKRLQHELEDYRSQRAMDIEDKETSLEQTRKKYQAEFSTMTNELEIERENVVFVRAENTHLREEIENLRAKWDDEVLNSSTWAKEKARLDVTLQDISASREEAVKAHNESQSKIVSMLSQVRTLRSSLDEAVAERDVLAKEKRSLETRLNDAAERLEELATSDSPSMRNAADMDKKLLQLQGGLAQQEDIASAAVGKMRRAEALAMEMQKDIASERESNVNLHKEKAQLEKTVKDLQVKLVDLETKSYSSSSQDVRFLNGRIQEVSRIVSFLFHFRRSVTQVVY